MNTKRKAQGKTHSKQVPISYNEVDFYRDRFAEWLITSPDGNEARGAFFALWALEIFSRVNVSAYDNEVARARRTVQKFLKVKFRAE